MRPDVHGTDGTNKIRIPSGEIKEVISFLRGKKLGLVILKNSDDVQEHKVPIEKDWINKEYTVEEAEGFIAKGYGIGLNLSKHEVFVIDIDEDSDDARYAIDVLKDKGAVIIKTTRGYHIFIKSEKYKGQKGIKKAKITVYGAEPIDLEGEFYTPEDNRNIVLPALGTTRYKLGGRVLYGVKYDISNFPEERQKNAHKLINLLSLIFSAANLDEFIDVRAGDESSRYGEVAGDSSLREQVYKKYFYKEGKKPLLLDKIMQRILENPPQRGQRHHELLHVALIVFESFGKNDDIAKIMRDTFIQVFAGERGAEREVEGIIKWAREKAPEVQVDNEENSARIKRFLKAKQELLEKCLVYKENGHFVLLGSNAYDEKGFVNKVRVMYHPLPKEDCTALWHVLLEEGKRVSKKHNVIIVSNSPVTDSNRTIYVLGEENKLYVSGQEGFGVYTLDKESGVWTRESGDGPETLENVYKFYSADGGRNLDETLDLKEIKQVFEIFFEDDALKNFAVLAPIYVGWADGIIALVGPSGSGKTVTSKGIQSIGTGPGNYVQIKSQDPMDYVAVVRFNRIIRLEETEITKDVQDIINTITTGSEHGRRKRFTDAELVSYKQRATFIINKIDLDGIRGDFARRLVIFDLSNYKKRYIEKRDSEEIESEIRDKIDKILALLFRIYPEFLKLYKKYEAEAKVRPSVYPRDIRNDSMIAWAKGAYIFAELLGIKKEEFVAHWRKIRSLAAQAGLGVWGPVLDLFESDERFRERMMNEGMTAEKIATIIAQSPEEINSIFIKLGKQVNIVQEAMLQLGYTIKVEKVKRKEGGGYQNVFKLIPIDQKENTVEDTNVREESNADDVFAAFDQEYTPLSQETQDQKDQNNDDDNDDTDPDDDPWDGGGGDPEDDGPVGVEVMYESDSEKDYDKGSDDMQVDSDEVMFNFSTEFSLDYIANEVKRLVLEDFDIKRDIKYTLYKTGPVPEFTPQFLEKIENKIKEKFEKYGYVFRTDGWLINNVSENVIVKQQVIIEKDGKDILLVEALGSSNKNSPYFIQDTLSYTDSANKMAYAVAKRRVFDMFLGGFLLELLDYIKELEQKGYDHNKIQESVIKDKGRFIDAKIEFFDVHPQHAEGVFYKALQKVREGDLYVEEVEAFEEKQKYLFTSNRFYYVLFQSIFDNFLRHYKQGWELWFAFDGNSEIINDPSGNKSLSLTVYYNMLGCNSMANISHDIIKENDHYFVDYNESQMSWILFQCFGPIAQFIRLTLENELFSLEEIKEKAKKKLKKASEITFTGIPTPTQPVPTPKPAPALTQPTPEPKPEPVPTPVHTVHETHKPTVRPNAQPTVQDQKPAVQPPTQPNTGNKGINHEAIVHEAKAKTLEAITVEDIQRTKDNMFIATKSLIDKLINALDGEMRKYGASMSIDFEFEEASPGFGHVRAVLQIKLGSTVVAKVEDICEDIIEESKFEEAIPERVIAAQKVLDIITGGFIKNMLMDIRNRVLGQGAYFKSAVSFEQAIYQLRQLAPSYRQRKPIPVEKENQIMTHAILHSHPGLFSYLVNGTTTVKTQKAFWYNVIYAYLALFLRQYKDGDGVFTVSFALRQKPGYNQYMKQYAVKWRVEKFDIKHEKVLDVFTKVEIEENDYKDPSLHDLISKTIKDEKIKEAIHTLILDTVYEFYTRARAEYFREAIKELADSYKESKWNYGKIQESIRAASQKLRQIHYS